MPFWLLNRKQKHPGLLLFFFFLLVLLFFSLFPPRFNDPACTVLLSQKGHLLAATIAEDEQCRFPVAPIIPDKFKKCILAFEDRHFYRHPGINPFSIARAAWNNLRARGIVQGGSTLSMQTVRLYRKGKSRTFAEKGIEAVLALRMEMAFSKKEILSLYAAHAPFGGNVVGLEAAAWCYYGRAAQDLSWAESAALAVLPNAPALVFPAHNDEALRRKRDNLLQYLFTQGTLDSLTYLLSLEEPLPQVAVCRYSGHRASQWCEPPRYRCHSPQGARHSVLPPCSTPGSINPKYLYHAIWTGCPLRPFLKWHTATNTSPFTGT